MADVFDFYVYDDRHIEFTTTEPILLEDNGVTDFKFRIPKVLNGIDMSGFAWWFVFANAERTTYSESLTLSDDEDDPDNYMTATYTVDYAMTIKAGTVFFSIEAINTDGTEIVNEWHTLTYRLTVYDTLQGNQAEYSETESDVISALIVELQTRVRQLVGGAVPTPVSSTSAMTDTSTIYLNTTDGYWYYYNGSAWTSGGVYASGLTVDDEPTENSTNLITSGAVYDLKEDLNHIANFEDTDTTGANYSPWISNRTLNSVGAIGSSGYYSACSTFIRVPDYVDTLTVTTGESYGAIFCRYSAPDESAFVDRVTYTANHGYTLDVSTYKYFRFAVGSTDVSDVGSVSISAPYPLKTNIDAIADKASDAITANYGKCTAISSGTDYDSLTTAGNYYCSSSSNASAMTNCPVTVAHRLTVITTTATARLWQIVMANNSSAEYYIRANTGSWQDWHKISTEETTVQSNDTTLTTANYTNYFTDCNNAPLNSVFTIRQGVPIANLPQGNSNVYGADDEYGYPGGTLITYKGGTYTGVTAVVQMFFTDVTDSIDTTKANSILCTRQGVYVSGAIRWSEWSKTGNAMCLHATNTSVQESRWQSGDAAFTDFDDAPNNSIYQIDLDCTSMLNNPLSGHSCILVTMGFSYISRHGMMQFCCGINSGAKLYYRYGYQQDTDTHVWTDWVQVNPESTSVYLENKGRLTNGTNLNTIIDNSIYLLGASGGYTNSPLDTSAGFLTTKTVDTLSMQTCERLNGTRYTRYTTDSGSTWTSWATA